MALSNFPLAEELDSVIVRRTTLEVHLPVSVDGTAAEVSEKSAGSLPSPWNLSTLEKTLLNLFNYAVRAKFGLPPVDVVSEQDLRCFIPN